jgi:hypothetical protein
MHEDEEIVFLSHLPRQHSLRLYEEVGTSESPRRQRHRSRGYMSIVLSRLDYKNPFVRMFYPRRQGLLYILLVDLYVENADRWSHRNSYYSIEALTCAWNSASLDMHKCIQESSKFNASILHFSYFFGGGGFPAALRFTPTLPSEILLLVALVVRVCSSGDRRKGYV